LLIGNVCGVIGGLSPSFTCARNCSQVGRTETQRHVLLLTSDPDYARRVELRAAAAAFRTIAGGPIDFLSQTSGWGRSRAPATL
jgi:hypothetical protein